MFWVYMLRCRDGSFYIGHTDHLEERMAAHTTGSFPCFTRERRPVQLVFSQEFPAREEALAMERRIKGWSRAKKQALINGDWAQMKELARGRHQHQRRARGDR
jgi:predicted GIY-YIG superfamily endonuclease